MKICVIGTRGFPNIQGGIETHCEELYTKIADNFNCEIIVFRRKPYVKEYNTIYKQIRFIDLWVPKNKYLETFLHSFLSTVYTIFLNPDIAHYHNTGPGAFIPILKLFNIKVVFTYHNLSYTQKKWNKASKLFLHLTERISINFSDSIIFISGTMKNILVEKYKLSKWEIIRNGIKTPKRAVHSDYLESLGLEKYNYILAIGRFLEEKGFDYLIDAYKLTGVSDIKLVIAGDTDYPTTYSKKLKNKAKANNIILTGFIKGEKLQQIFSFSRLYIMSSFQEGLPISLLEAMSYNIDVLSSDIPPNLEVGLEENDYFEAGNSEVLSRKILAKLQNPTVRDFDNKLNETYNWDSIALSTFNVYKKTLNQ
ncbi:hypothetical protein SAMN05444280_11197 [Tangfeifania diversioriginum]|uniref:Uncharacterized protein n=1 Tax=Tangfeifania diversioriginum TaxID=1168035 RepID=A0A1M6GRT2_9BACT|nr:glycosyltransferase family 4 protein [Tangfeifania diversioriginum]SHJ12685.1 hypothetical protein SAMN05444280_11197 [Tangfeifania diversioriginum]